MKLLALALQEPMFLIGTFNAPGKPETYRIQATRSLATRQITTRFDEKRLSQTSEKNAKATNRDQKDKQARRLPPDNQLAIQYIAQHRQTNDHHPHRTRFVESETRFTSEKVA